MPIERPRAFVLGGSLPRRWSSDHLPGLLAIGAVLAVVAIPLRGLYRATGASMEEGFMLLFPTLATEGRIPNVDFLHLYGPTSLNLLSIWYAVFGDSLESERTFGLLQHLGIVFAIYTLARAYGHLVATGAAVVATFLILTPIGLSALAWHGGLAFGLWSIVFAARGRTTTRKRDWWFSGCFAGLALGFRPDLVIALALALGYATWLRRKDRWQILFGAGVGLLPMWIHLLRAGPAAAIDGMVLDPVFRLRAGRALPRPPTFDRIDGALQAVAESLPPWWRLPALPASQQLFFWFWMVLLIAGGVAWWAIRRHRRDGGLPGSPSDLLVMASLFGVGIVPQALQRPDSTHLAWVSVVSWALLVIVLDRLIRPHVRRDWHASVLATGALGLLMLVVCPFFTFRPYLLQTRVAVGDLPPPFEIERDGRRFWVGDPAVKAAIDEMMPELDARSEPGDRLIVGPGDLSRTIYADTYIYWLFSELEPATYFIEMDPGLADAEDSGLSDDLLTADFVVLTNTWSGWVEPNDSAVSRSQEHNETIADHFCLVGSYNTNLVLLFERCEGGGGFDPSTVAGRAPGVAGGGIDPTVEP